MGNSPAQQPRSALKVPPQSLAAEQAVIGGLLLENEAWERVSEILTASDFYRSDHRKIFSSIHALAEDSKPFDLITLSESLEQQGELENIGGLAYIGTLAKETPSAANIRHYAEIVRENSTLRQLISVGTAIVDSAFDRGEMNSATVLDEAERMVLEISEKKAKTTQGFAPLKSIMKTTIERIEHLRESGDAYTGLATGYKAFDDMTSGLQRSDLIIIAGRPSMGKTAFSMNLVEHVAIKHKLPVAVFSMEMPKESLASRMLSSLGRINQQNIRIGNLEDDEWPRLSSAVSILADAPIFIDDSPALNPMEIRSRARRLKREQKQLGLIVIDYLQLMQGGKSNQENRAQEISDISRSLKALAKELDTPVIALSQLNRNLEQRPNKRPVMSDLRESGSIEQDADLIVFIYRDEVYNKESAEKGTAEIIIGKQRNGPIGTARLAFLGQFTRFENLAQGDYYPDSDY